MNCKNFRRQKEVNISDSGLGNDSLDRTLKMQVTKEKIDKLNHIKIKN
jgi:hypothetical protein